MSTPTVSFTDERLANGLRLVIAEDHLAPVVAVNIWYGVGSKNEVPGKTGFAHLFEHVMFQGSRNVAKAEHIALVQAAGGTMNGTTWLDRTNYFETVPSHQLELALWLEADRMGTLLDALSQENLDNQREVVKNEKRWSYDNRPYGSWNEKIQAHLFPPEHPYHHTTIGSMEDLDAASVEDVSEFFRTYYAPNNAVLSIVGDVDPAAVRAWTERYFGGIPANPSIPPLGDLSLPPTLGEERRETVYDKIPLPRVYVAYRAPVFGDTRLDALDIASQVLAGGKGSRLHRRLVRDERIAQDVALFTLGFVGGASITAGWATVRPGVDVARSRPRSTRSSNGSRANRSRPTSSSGRRRSSRATSSGARPGRGAGRPPVDVRDAVRRPGADQPDAAALPRSDGRGHPSRRGGGLPGRQPRRADVPPGAAARRCRVGRRPRPRARRRRHDRLGCDRRRGPADARHPPAVRLPDGRAVHARQRPPGRRRGPSRAAAGLGFARVPQRGGRRTAGPCRRDGPRRPRHDRRDVAVRRDRARRGHASGSARRSTPTPAGTPRASASTFLPARLEAALELLAEVALHPTFPEAEVERLRDERLNDLLQARADPRRRADEAYSATIYEAAAPYHRPAGGTRETVAELTPARLRAAYERGSTRPGRRSSSAATWPGSTCARSPSASSAAGARPWARPRAVGSSTPAPSASGSSASSTGRARSRPRSASAMSACRAGSTDFHAMSVMGAILGGLFNSRLNMKLREEKGYTYGAGAGFDLRRAAGPFSARAAVNTEVTVPAVADFVAELDRIRDTTVTPAELAAARDFLVGVFPLRFETPGPIVGALPGCSSTSSPTTSWSTTARRSRP